ncbi:MAG: ATPase P [Deltaproteobacteria bacterium]|nr:ATPase P [Deltaproteobacteria bacterium]
MGVDLEIAGRTVAIETLLLDFTGTLSKDGRILPGVAARLKTISKRLKIVILTADTFGTAKKALSDLPVEVNLIATGIDKARFIRRAGPGSVMAVGNGRNDVSMVSLAALGIAVVGPEGAAGELVRSADIVVREINDALDLLLHPQRLKATLRD